MKKFVLYGLFLSVIFHPISFSHGAVKKAVKAPQKKATAQSSAGNVIVTAAVNKAQTNVTVYFKNLQKASSVNYQLSYLTNGKQEGAGGALDIARKYSLSRTLLFGTCSAGVCRYHGGISNAKLHIEISYKNGRKENKTIPLSVRGSGTVVKNGKAVIGAKKKPVKKAVKKVTTINKKSSKK